MTESIVQKTFGYFFNVIHDFILFLISKLPDSTGLPTQIHDSWVLILGYMSAFSFLFPFNTIIQILYLTAYMYIGIGIFKVLNYIANRIWGHG